MLSIVEQTILGFGRRPEKKMGCLCPPPPTKLINVLLNIWLLVNRSGLSLSGKCVKSSIHICLFGFFGWLFCQSYFGCHDILMKGRMKGRKATFRHDHAVDWYAKQQLKETNLTVKNSEIIPAIIKFICYSRKGQKQSPCAMLWLSQVPLSNTKTLRLLITVNTSMDDLCEAF